MSLLWLTLIVVCVIYKSLFICNNYKIRKDFFFFTLLNFSARLYLGYSNVILNISNTLFSTEKALYKAKTVCLLLSKKIYYNLLPIYMYSSVVADEISFILEIYKS